MRNMKTKRLSVVDKRVLSFIPYKYVVVLTPLSLEDAACSLQTKGKKQNASSNQN